MRDGGVLLEVIIGGPDDARAAAGADRFELCSALALGGLTPSLGTLEAVLSVSCTPVMFMLRPRESGMAYSDGEADVIIRDAELALGAGAAGLVTGFLTPGGDLDLARCRRLIRQAEAARPRGSFQLVFHRAFDVVRDPDTALEQLIDLGFDRILTSGRRARATDGLDEIRRMIDLAADRIAILPGGGLRPADLHRVVRETGCREVHLSLGDFGADPSVAGNPEIAFGADLPPREQDYRRTSRDLVTAAREALGSIPLRATAGSYPQAS